MAEEVSIGPYRIVRRLGFGRSSEVLLATRLFPGDFERRVVIKRLLAPLANDADCPTVLATEALAYARVAHPAIVQLFDFFSYEGRLALVLEYVDGPSLSRLQASLRAHRESLGDRVSFFIASRIFAALAAAHSARDPRSGVPTPVIHRDVSPSNVLVPWDGFVKLGDFDLAKVMGVTGETRGGLLKGTYGYMAPEQVNGDPVTPRTDVYAGCLVLRELLVSRPAFDEELPELELLRAMDASRLPPVEAIRGGISRKLADAMRRGLARDPLQRTLTAAEMVDVLRAEVGDQEAAHADLTAILKRHRPVEARGSVSQQARTPASGVRVLSPEPPDDTPRTMSLALQSVPPVERAPSSIRIPVGSRHPFLAVAAALGAMAVLAFAYVAHRATGAMGAMSAAGEEESAPRAAASETLERTELKSAAPLATAATAAAPAPKPAAIAEPPLSASSAPLASAVSAGSLSASNPGPTSGDIVTPASAHGHRVWVDGRVASWSSGSTLRVPCGTHVVRIGSTGDSKSVLVPCNGRIILGGM